MAYSSETCYSSMHGRPGASNGDKGQPPTAADERWFGNAALIRKYSAM